MKYDKHDFAVRRTNCNCHNFKKIIIILKKTTENPSYKLLLVYQYK